MSEIMIKDLYNMNETIAAELFDGLTYPWEALPKISEFIKKLGETLDPEEYDKVGEDVWIAKSANVFPSAYVHGPAIIGKDAEVRHCAFIRGNAIVGEGAVVGNSTELKNVVLFNKVQVPHYNYVGDSILGYKAHMGAGSITSNVKSDKKLVKVHTPEGDIETGIKKFGAMIGDNVEVGCGSVLNPGTVIGRESNIYPLSDPARRSAYHGEVTMDRYGRKVPRHGHGTIHLTDFTSSSAEIIEAAMTLYDRITSPALLIRRLNLSADHVIPKDQVKKEETYEQLSLFSDPSKEEAEKIQREASRERERRLQTAMLAIKDRYGKNAILRGTDLEDGATTMERNNQIGGHKA